MNEREQARLKWLQKNLSSFELPALLAGDASFRCYFRLRSEETSYVLMDAPPEHESCQSFIAIDRAFQQLGLRVPEIYCSDSAQGFLLLSDFGDRQLLQSLSSDSVDHYYRSALEDLLVIQQYQEADNYVLPTFDVDLYQRELDLFKEWYLKRHLGLDLSIADHQALDRLSQLLIEMALLQPQVCVHRDYHSRNLMVLPENDLGILDFQDAVWGPITYDLMSLLRDCYIAWPYDRVKEWALWFQQRLLQSGLLPVDDPDQFLLWCDWIALQRHLKCIGIFSRLHYRDHKSNYLSDIPRVLDYVKSVCQRQPQFGSLLGRFI